MEIISGLIGAVIGAGGVITSQIIGNRYNRVENERQRSIEAALRLTELAAARGMVDPMIPTSNNDNYVANYNRFLDNITNR